MLCYICEQPIAPGTGHNGEFIITATTVETTPEGMVASTNPVGTVIAAICDFCNEYEEVLALESMALEAEQISRELGL